MANKKINILEQIFKKYNISLEKNNKLRNPIDILEDVYLKLNGDDWNTLCSIIAKTESQEGPIFDMARGRPYE